MGKGIHQFRLNNRNCLTFYVYEDDYEKQRVYPIQGFENDLFHYIDIIGEQLHYPKALQTVYVEGRFFGARRLANQLFDLVTKIEEGYVAFTMVPDIHNSDLNYFREKLYAKSANALLRNLVAKLPVRCYGGPWTRGILLTEEEVRNNNAHHYKPI